MNNDNNKNIIVQLGVILLVLVLGFCIPIIYNIFNAQVRDVEIHRKNAEKNSIRWEDVEAHRGTIYSADGKILSTSLPIYDVYIDLGEHKQKNINRKGNEPEYESIPMIPDSVFNQDIEELCKNLADLFKDKTAEEYLSGLTTGRKAKSRRYPIQRNISYDQLQEMKTFPILCRQISEKKRGKNGKPDTTTIRQQSTKDVIKFRYDTLNRTYQFRRAVIVDERSVRLNPYGNLARHTIGFAVVDQKEITKSNGKKEKIDTIKYRGLDDFYDTYLRGQQGKRKVRLLTRGVWIPMDDEEQRRAIDGNDIVSTIDTRLQDLAESSLRKCLIENEADYGCVVLMEVETGYIRAISNLNYIDSTIGYREIRNTACLDLYDPGSTFKTVTAMVLLENELCDTSYLVPTGTKQFNPKNKESIIHDVNKTSIDTISMKRSFEISSNVGTCQPVWDFYKDNRQGFANEVQRFLPYKKLNIDLNIGGEPMPKISDDFGPDRNFLTFAYGYASNFTALQLLTFYNAIANNGKMVKPLFCSEIRDINSTIKKIEPVVIKEKICSQQTLNKIHSMLVGVVENGSARRLSKTPYGIAGKTGTSQINYAQKGKSHMKYRASFAGYFPADDPKYSCIVVITNPKKNKQHGGEIAAPVFKNLADRVCGTMLDSEMHITTAEEKQKPFITKGNNSEIKSFFEAIDIENEYRNNTELWSECYIDSNDIMAYRAYKPRIGSVPDCYGMTIKDAMYMLEKMGLKVTFSGRGKVVEQSLKPFSSYKKGSKIHLRLGITSRKNIPIEKRINTTINDEKN